MHVRLVTNSVKQGGILLPMLFNRYIDALRITLTQFAIGGDIGRHLIKYQC